MDLFKDVSREVPTLELTAELVELNHRLGLPALNRTICMGFSNACVCVDCLKRERQTAKKRAVQPWEPRKAA